MVYRQNESPKEVRKFDLKLELDGILEAIKAFAVQILGISSTVSILEINKNRKTDISFTRTYVIIFDVDKI